MTTISSIDARFAQQQIGISSNKVTSSIGNLVTGKKTDANVADLSVGTVLATRVGTLRVAVGNAGQAKSLLETAKGALDTILELLQKQKNLAAKSADDSLSDNERGFLNQEFQAIVSEVDRIASNANFNGKALLDGSISGVASLTSATTLADDNFGMISSGNLRLSGTVESGNLSTTAAKFAENKIHFTTAGTGTTATFVLTGASNSLFEGVATTVNFTTGTTVEATASAFVAAVSTYTAGTDAQDNLIRNFNFIDNGDGTVSVKAKESGTQFDGATFNFTAMGGMTANSVFLGLDGSNTEIDANATAFNANIPSSPSNYAASADGTFRTIRAANIGSTAAVNYLTFGAVDTDTGGTTLDIEVVGGGVTSTVNVTVANNDTAAAVTAKVVAALNNFTTYTSTSVNANALRNFTFSVDPSDTARMLITANTLGSNTALEQYTFEVVDNSTGVTGVFGATSIVDSATAFDIGTAYADGSNRSVAVVDETIDTNLIGSFSDFSAVFTKGGSGGNNTVQFYVKVDGITYQSQDIRLFDTSSATKSAILANTDILFYNAAGPRSASGELTDNGFILRTGSSAIQFSDVSSQAAGQESASDVASALETQLAAVSIVQERNLNVEQILPANGDHRVSGAVGTILEGLKGFDVVGDDVTGYNDGDIRLISDAYASTGSQGSVGRFTVDRLTNTITTSIGGQQYTAYLTSAALPSVGGALEFGKDLNGGSNIGSYDSTTKILTLNDGTGNGTTAATGGTSGVQSTAKLVFYSDDTSDGKALIIDLGNVADNISQINISTEEGETALSDALNAIFGVSSNESLNFQVGVEASDSIGVSIGSAKTRDIFVDDDGVAQELSVATIEDAQAASPVLDNAINNVISLISDVSAAITAFDSSIRNNQASIQNADAARSKLLDTDYTAESTAFAESRVRVDAATAVLTQINSRIQNLLQLLQQ